MASAKVLVSLALLVATDLAVASVESNNSVENATHVTGRSARKDYVVYSPPDNFASKNDNFYSPDDTVKGDDDIPSGFEPRIDTRQKKENASPPEVSPSAYEEYVPVGYYRQPNPPRQNPRYYTSGPNGPMYKSGSSNNWNVWKGDMMETVPAPPAGHKGGPPPDFSEFYFPAEAWKGDPWPADHMPAMMMMMNQMQAANKPKLGGFLSKLAQDPGALLVAAILPFSLLLAAVLPTLMNMMMNGGLPTVTTTATGNTGRNLDGTEFLSPVLQTITAFGGRAFDNPDCMQKIFCQVTKGPQGNGTEGRSFQRALYSASTLIDSHWLETFGVKTLFESMADGNCEKIPCSTLNPSPRSSAHKKKAT